MLTDKLILAIDFNNILFSSYYSEKLINSHGINVNAIKGFFFKLKALKESLNPDYIVIANDINRSKTFRRKLYEPYKGNRKTHDNDIITQLQYTQQIAALIGFPFINDELYEADDVLGMIGKFADEQGATVIIVSSDKDLYQLISDKVNILSPRNNQLIDIEWMRDKFDLTPSQWIDYKILVGDNGDNIPGVRKVGNITALKLLHEYRNVDNIYNHITELPIALQDNLNIAHDMIPLIRTLVTIVTDYTKINLTEEMLMPNERFENDVYNLLYELELFSLFDVMKSSLMQQELLEYKNYF